MPPFGAKNGDCPPIVVLQSSSPTRESPQNRGLSPSICPHFIVARTEIGDCPQFIDVRPRVPEVGRREASLENLLCLLEDLHQEGLSSVITGSAHQVPHHDVKQSVSIEIAQIQGGEITA